MQGFKPFLIDLQDSLFAYVTLLANGHKRFPGKAPLKNLLSQGFWHTAVIILATLPEAPVPNRVFRGVIILGDGNIGFACFPAPNDIVNLFLSEGAVDSSESKFMSFGNGSASHRCCPFFNGFRRLLYASSALADFPAELF